MDPTLWLLSSLIVFNASSSVASLFQVDGPIHASDGLDATHYYEVPRALAFKSLWGYYSSSRTGTSLNSAERVGLTKPFPSDDSDPSIIVRHFCLFIVRHSWSLITIRRRNWYSYLPTIPTIAVQLIGHLGMFGIPKSHGLDKAMAIFACDRELWMSSIQLPGHLFGLLLSINASTVLLLY